MKTKATTIFSIIAMLFAAFASPVLAAPALAAGTSTSIISATSYSPQPGDVKSYPRQGVHRHGKKPPDRIHRLTGKSVGIPDRVSPRPLPRFTCRCGFCFHL